MSRRILGLGWRGSHQPGRAGAAWRLAAPAAAAALLAAAAVGASSAQAAPSPVNYLDDVDANVTAQIVAESITKEVAADPTYAGMAIRPGGLEISAVAGGSAALKAAAGDKFDVPVSVRTVAHSFADLQAITADLDSRADALRDEGFPMAMWGPDYETDKVHVTVEKANPAMAAQITAQYGPDLLVVDEATGSNEGSSRENDTSPFYAGDHIHGPSHCTNWFTARTTSGAFRELTAGHCGSGLWQVYAGDIIGSTSTLLWSGNVDAQTIVASGLAYAWGDPNVTLRPVKSISTSNPIGALICTDGYVDREVCSVEVVNGSISVTYDGHTVTDTVRAHQKANIPAFTPGDSGGPVYTSLSGGGLSARGMILSHATGDNSTGNYGKVANIISRFGVTVYLAP